MTWKTKEDMARYTEDLEEMGVDWSEVRQTASDRATMETTRRPMARL